MPVDPLIFATSDQPITSACVKQLAADFSEAIGEDRLLDSDGRGVIVMEAPDHYPLLPDQLPWATSILRPRLSTPYYGAGYERGDWPAIAATLEFLRRRVTHGRVWYGRDDADVVNEVSSKFMDSLWDHWSRYGGRPYYSQCR